MAFCGETLEFTLRLSQPAEGEARLRTNIGHAATARREIILESAARQKRLAEDWFDIPMMRLDKRSFRLTLPLLESGHFEAKALFLPQNELQPLWPKGPNTIVNVHPAQFCCANSIYNAFTRQFGRETNPVSTMSADQQASLSALERNGYTIIPRSGTFRDLIRQLDFIVEKLRCRILMLLPIHPTPTVYGRMGRFGSPYAALDFMDVDPALAEFDPKATPLEQFGELVDAVHARNARLFLDIAINHTGWASKIHSEHPDWLLRDKEGRIHSPGAWGVTWEDLTELDHQRVELWRHLAEVFLTWCRRGADGFRCDAGYMIPVPAWELIVATVRRDFPDTLFLLEGLGGKIEVTAELLNTANLNWAYSELFQNYDRRQIESYLPQAIEISKSNGLLVHFAETHDNNRLASRSTAYARMRTALAALASHNGAFAFANGVEWHATEKIDVHGRSPLNWGAKENQVDHIARLNAILHTHPAFGIGSRISLIGQGPGNSLTLLRQAKDGTKRLLILINPDDSVEQPASWNTNACGMAPAALTDLISGRRIQPAINGADAQLTLAPAETLCLTEDAQEATELARAADNQPAGRPPAVLRQCLRAAALEIIAAAQPHKNDFGDCNPDQLALALAQNPRAFLRQHLAQGTEKRVIAWEWPRDTKRTVMIPPDFALYLHSPTPFRARIEIGARVLRQTDALPAEDGSFFAILPPRAAPRNILKAGLALTIFDHNRVRHLTAPLWFLPESRDPEIPVTFTHADLIEQHPLLLSVNGRGAMMRAGVKWAELRSRYDALLAGNLHPDWPEDRRIMLARCRAWLVFQGYSQDISFERLRLFELEENAGRWRFRIPFGFGKSVHLIIHAQMRPDQNAITLTFQRQQAGCAANLLDDASPVTLIIRPDIEDRSFHEDTKAFMGPEQTWPGAMRNEPDGFVFEPDHNRRLRLNLPTGKFHPEPEWQYMIHHPVEAERGLQADSDLFSPGYFTCQLPGGHTAQLFAEILAPPQAATISTPKAAPGKDQPRPNTKPLSVMLTNAIRQFVAKRGAGKTVIAGYPWFLDWGRDTFICARGLLSAGLHAEVAEILRQFACFEENGTLPNIIYGNDARNRDTSDAPLWFIIAAADACRLTNSAKILDLKCGQRALREVLESIAENYRRGTPNGIKMDEQSGLIFSPPHFTWMDTNFPAGTPREGYPIEIQALWLTALIFLAQEGRHSKRWSELAETARASIIRRYWSEARGFLADCLHARHGQAAAQAVPDDALRPNQLFAITLGALADSAMAQSILDACAELLAPGAMRSLADRPVEQPLPIYHNQQQLNDALHPYWGRYEGDEDYRRKPAYHNGTAWTWLLPTFCEAWALTHGAQATARAWLGSVAPLLTTGCLGQIPEILDGDHPHQPRGCDAQAWSATEFYRVWKLLQNPG